MKKNIFFGILLFAVTSLISFGVAHAFFVSGASNINNSFTAAVTFPTPTGAENLTPTPTLTTTPTPTSTPTHIVINEISPIGTSSADWVELFNPTASPVDVSGWTITDNNSSDTFPSVPAIPSGGFAVIITSSSSVVVPNTAQIIQLANSTIGNGLAAGGDEIVLKNVSNTIIDAMSFGTDTSIFTIPAPTGSQTIARHPNGFDTDSATDWSDGVATLGVTN